MTEHNKISSLDETFFEKASETSDLWKSLYRSTAPLDHSRVEKIINAIYLAENLNPPAIYYCQSPWQMCLMPTTLLCTKKLQGFLSERFQTPVEALLKSNLEQECGSVLTDSLMRRLDEQVALNGIVDPGKSLWNFFDSRMCDGSTHPEVYEQMNYFEPLIWHEASQFYRRVVFQRQADIFNAIKDGLKSHPPDGLWPPFGMEHHDFVKAKLIEETNHPQFIRPHYFDASRSIWFALILLVQDFVNDRFNAGLVPTKETELMVEAMQNTHMFLPFENICFVSERPTTISLLGDGGLHNTKGPTIAYSDGFNIYYWRNMLIPRSFVENADATTYEDIEKQENLELRRAMIEIYGEQRYIADSNVKPMHKDHYGTLYRRVDPGHDDVVMVKVTNRTKEEDGSKREYWIRVPPGVRTAKEAVAWTFFMSEDDYEPEVES